MSITFVVNALLVIAAVQALEFITAYHWQTRGHWRRSPMGRHLMIFMMALAAVLALAATRVVLMHVFGIIPPGWYRWLQIAVFVSIPIVLAQRRWLLARAQRELAD